LSTFTLAEHQADILGSLRRLKGRGTVGDVVADSGLSGDDVRSGLKALLESHQGHLAVSDIGELLYEFDEKLIVRGTEPVLARLKRTATDVFTKGFKVTIVIVLVVYFLVFVALVIAALFANKNSDSRGGGVLGGRRGRGHSHFHFGDFWLWYYIWTPRWRLGRPYYGHRWESTLAKEDRPPFYKKVFAFVFGPDKPNPTQSQLDRSTIRLIRARKGVITTAELVEHTALTFPEAEDEMGRLIGAYDGEAAISPDGELVYAFPELMLSAHDQRPREPNPAWLRLERKQELTGNTAGANAVVAGMNGFTLVAAATAPWFIFPRLGIGGPAAFVGLVLVPFVFSILFYGVPFLRMWGVTRENKQREKQNIRRVLLGLVYSRSLGRERDVGEGEAHEHVVARLKSQVVKQADVDAAIRALAAELDAEVEVDDTGGTRYRFPALRRQFSASETVRRKLQLENRTLGEIVFSTSDSAIEAGEREFALFDRELTDGEADFDRYLPSLDKIGFEDDYDLVAFDEELKQRSLSRA
jgi:hypothetical protein